MNSNLYQTFYIIGLDNEIAMSSDPLYRNPHIFSAVPTIISKYPQIKESYNLIPDNLVILHCFPQGYRILDNEPEFKTAFYTFRLENLPFINVDNQKYAKMYFSCLLFYESLYDYYILKKKSNDNNTNMLDDENILRKFYVPKVICLASLLPFPEETKIILETLFKLYGNNTININNNVSNVSPTEEISTDNTTDTNISDENNKNKNIKTLPPIEKEIENIIFGIPYIPNSGQCIIYNIVDTSIKFKRSPLNQQPNISYNLSLFFNENNIIHIMKAYKCLLLEIPILFFSKDITLLTTVTEGLNILLYPFEYQYPFISVLPVNSYSLIEASHCYCLGINETYKENFFEVNNLEIDDKTIAIVDLDSNPIRVFPTKTQETKDEINCLILNANTNSTNWEEEMKYRNNLYFIADLPIHYKNKLIDHINIYSKDPNINESNTFDDYIKDKFFSFLISILKEYSKYIEISNEKLIEFDKEFLNKRSSTVNITSVFNVQNFVNKITSKDVEFYKRFLDTELFKSFMIIKIFPQSIEDKIQILFFDEKISAKNARSKFTIKKKKTPLIETKIIQNTPDIIVTSTTSFTKEEQTLISNPHSIKDALSYYQQITTDNQNISISYTIFPKLLYDGVFFTKSCLTKKLSSSTSNIVDCTNINTIYTNLINDKRFHEIYSDDPNYSLNLFLNSNYHKIKMRNFVELTWLLVLSGSLWYCNEYERNIRIYRAFAIIEKIELIHEDVFEFFYFVLIKYSDDVNIIRMYEMLNRIRCLGKGNYTNFALLCMKMTSDFEINDVLNAEPIIQKKKTIKITLLMRESETNDDDKTNNENKSIYQGRSSENFRKRSLFDNCSLDDFENDNNVTEEIKFDNVHVCEFCGNSYELVLESILDFENSIETFNFPCTKCGKVITKGSLRIKLQIKRIIKKEDENTGSYTYVDDICETKQYGLLTPFEMLDCSKKLLLKGEECKIDIIDLKENCEKLFYNYIFYFSIAKLPFDFIVPFQNRTLNNNIEPINEKFDEDDVEK